MFFKENPNDAEVVMPLKETYAFRPWLVVSAWIMKMAGYNNFAFTDEPEGLDERIIKIGFGDNKPTLIRHNNVAYGTAGLLWKEYGENIFKGWSDSERKDYLLYKRLDRQVIESFDREEQNVKNICNTIGTGLRKFSLTKGEEKANRDWKGSFEDAIEWLDVYMRNEIAHIEETIF